MSLFKKKNDKKINVHDTEKSKKLQAMSELLKASNSEALKAMQKKHARVEWQTEENKDKAVDIQELKPLSELTEMAKKEGNGAKDINLGDKNIGSISKNIGTSKNTSNNALNNVLNSSLNSNLNNASNSALNGNPNGKPSSREIKKEKRRLKKEQKAIKNEKKLKDNKEDANNIFKHNADLNNGSSEPMDFKNKIPKGNISEVWREDEEKALNEELEKYRQGKVLNNGSALGANFGSNFRSNEAQGDNLNFNSEMGKAGLNMASSTMNPNGIYWDNKNKKMPKFKNAQEQAKYARKQAKLQEKNEIKANKRAQKLAKRQNTGRGRKNKKAVKVFSVFFVILIIAAAIISSILLINHNKQKAEIAKKAQEAQSLLNAQIEEKEYTEVPGTSTKYKQNISLSATSVIPNVREAVKYTINYTASVREYSGNATITIVDTLPYVIDEDHSDLAGGKYDASSKTITWTETTNNINTNDSQDKKKDITISKSISLAYLEISTTTISIKNQITGKTNLTSLNQDTNTVIAEGTTTTKFVVDVPVSIIWDDYSNKVNKRPESLKVTLTGSDGKTYSKELTRPELNDSTMYESGSQDTWTDVFEDLPKYDDNKKEITYKLSQEAKNKDDLKFYDMGIPEDSQNGKIKQVKNTLNYGRVVIHSYVENADGSATQNRVLSKDNSTEVQDIYLEGRVGEKYTAKPSDNISAKYELDNSKLPQNVSGTYEKFDENNTKELIYYYKEKAGTVTVKYLEKDGDSDDSNNKVLANPEVITGSINTSYNVEDPNSNKKKDTITKDGKNYSISSDSGNKTGTITPNGITVTYYYVPKSTVKIRYVERSNTDHSTIVKDIDLPTTKEGNVGDKIDTFSKNFTGYILVQAPTKQQVTVTEDEQTIIYYYEKITSGIVETDIDSVTGNIISTQVHAGVTGQSYNITAKTFPGYDVNSLNMPNNSTGTLAGAYTEVKFYYTKKATLELNYIDKATGKTLADTITDVSKHEGDSYTTESKTFSGYDLLETPSNANGKISVALNETGGIANEKTVVNYYYAKPATVETHYIEAVTNKELEATTTQKVHYGDNYEVNPKELTGYKLVEKDDSGKSALPANSKGTINQDKIVINYYYYKPAKLVVHYVDKITNKEIVYKDTNNHFVSSRAEAIGKSGQNYITEQKVFQYYNFVGNSDNTAGTLNISTTKDQEGKDVINDTTDVYYYYEPKLFNITADNSITKVVVNGVEKPISDSHMTKYEIDKKSDVSNTNLQIEYTIKITNSGEIDGSVSFTQSLPKGMNLISNDGTWQESDGTLSAIIPKLHSGETKEYKIVLNWNKKESNLGTKDSKLTLTRISNIQGLKNNEANNTSEAKAVIATATGKLPWGFISFLAVLAIFELCTLIYSKRVTNKTKSQTMLDQARRDQIRMQQAMDRERATGVNVPRNRSNNMRQNFGLNGKQNAGQNRGQNITQNSMPNNMPNSMQNNDAEPKMKNQILGQGWNNPNRK